MSYIDHCTGQSLSGRSRKCSHDTSTEQAPKAAGNTSPDAGDEQHKRRDHEDWASAKILCRGNPDEVLNGTNVSLVLCSLWHDNGLEVYQMMGWVACVLT